MKDDHAQLQQYSSHQSGKAAASQRHNAAAIRKLDDELQQISEDRRNESAAATEAAAEERERLLNQLDTLTRCVLNVLGHAIVMVVPCSLPVATCCQACLCQVCSPPSTWSVQHVQLYSLSSSLSSHHTLQSAHGILLSKMSTRSGFSSAASVTCWMILIMPQASTAGTTHSSSRAFRRCSASTRLKVTRQCVIQK